ncbi:MAG: uL15 family ribosomal protein [Nanoarchaeota archaeon]|nr:uL15 family ribosomal protein [Nanoarchaeota archaeon]
MNKKRKKNTRHRGSHTHSGGAKKKGRGSGHRGGVGNAGSGKRADQKKNTTIKRKKTGYFGKLGARRKKIIKRLNVINLREISEKYAGKTEVRLENYKILATGELTEKIKITAASASKTAIDKVKKAGGDIIIPTKESKE